MATLNRNQRINAVLNGVGNDYPTEGFYYGFDNTNEDKFNSSQAVEEFGIKTDSYNIVVDVFKNLFTGKITEIDIIDVNDEENNECLLTSTDVEFTKLVDFIKNNFKFHFSEYIYEEVDLPKLSIVDNFGELEEFLSNNENTDEFYNFNDVSFDINSPVITLTNDRFDRVYTDLTVKVEIKDLKEAIKNNFADNFLDDLIREAYKSEKHKLYENLDEVEYKEVLANLRLSFQCLLKNKI